MSGRLPQPSLPTGGAVAVCSSVEHPAVLKPVHGVGGELCSVDATGRIDLDHLEALIGPATAVVSVMLANNETGVIQPLDQVVALVGEHSPDALVHTDAVHAVAWLDVAEMAGGVDLVSISAHKFGGPVGVGVLVDRAPSSGVGARPRSGSRSSRKISPQLLGGSQERGLRAGTQPVALVAAMAAALEATVSSRADDVTRVSGLRDTLVEGLLGAIPDVSETGRPAELVSAAPDALRRWRAEHKVGGSCHLVVEGVDAQELLFLLDTHGIRASAGSSCASGALEPSHVLMAMGMSVRAARSAVRLSLGRPTTPEDVSRAIATIPDLVTRLRS